MALDILNLEESTITTGLEGKFLAWYGVNNVGKSYVASELFPGQTLWLATENGTAAIPGVYTVNIETWRDFRNVVSQLTTKNKTKREKLEEKYKCVVIDVMDRLPALCTDYVVNDYNERNADKPGFVPIKDITGIPWGAGKGIRDKEKDFWLNKLSLSKYCKVGIFHQEIKKTKIDGEEIECVVPRNTSDKFGATFTDLPDFFFWVENMGANEDGSPRLSVGHCVQNQNYFARSRFFSCDFNVAPFTAENVKKAVKEACEKEAARRNVSTVTYDQEFAKREREKTEKKKTSQELIDEIAPIYKALHEAGFGSYMGSIVGDFLGYDENDKPNKISKATENQTEALQGIYDKFLDMAEEKGIDWE